MSTFESTLRRAARTLRFALLGCAIGVGTCAQAQKAFPSAADAADAFVDAVARHDGQALKLVVGADYSKYLPHGNAEDVTQFLEAFARSHKIVSAGDARAYLEVGSNGWTMPIPIVRTSAGWAFDPKQTPEELRLRRVGRNELEAIQVVLAYTDAQEDYAKYDRDRNGRADYAQKLISSPGRHDGLYWPSKPGGPESPLGSEAVMTKPGEGFHGYQYRVLAAQGKNAPGGAKSYVVDGAMTGGYALVAWPAKWGETGVMSFIVSKDGIVYEKDLGPDSARIAAAMTAYDPDGSWVKVAQK